MHTSNLFYIGVFSGSTFLEKQLLQVMQGAFMVNSLSYLNTRVPIILCFMPCAISALLWVHGEVQEHFLFDNSVCINLPPNDNLEE